MHGVTAHSAQGLDYGDGFRFVAEFGISPRIGADNGSANGSAGSKLG